MNKISKIINQAGLNFDQKMFVINNEDYFSQFGDYSWAETKPLIQVEDKVLEKYQWKLIKPDGDQAVNKVYNSQPQLGYFIRSKPNSKAVGSINTCYLISQPQLEQNVHNIIIGQKNSRLQILTGCTALDQMPVNIHNGVTEIYVEENAEVVFTMVHSWNKNSQVHPRTVVQVEKGGKFISNYLIFDPVKKLDTNPQVFLKGANSKAVLKSFVYSHSGVDIELGGEIYLEAPEARGEVQTHAVVAGGGKTLTRGRLVGRAEKVRAHLECSAIILSPDAKFRTVPELQAEMDNLDLSHEASIGKISSEEIEYLQSRGISREEARQMVVRGFIDQSIGDLSPVLQNKVDRVISQSKYGL